MGLNSAEVVRSWLIFLISCLKLLTPLWTVGHVLHGWSSPLSWVIVLKKTPDEHNSVIADLGLSLIYKFK